MTIRILTDSTSDLPAELVARYGITIIPMWLNIDDRGYRDGIDIGRDEFYERLPTFRSPPTTSVASPEFFRLEYERLAGEGASEILSIHVSPNLSGVLNAATLARQEVSAIPITILDGRQLSLGTGYVVLRAAEMATAGAAMDEILPALEELIPRIRVFAAADTLEYLQRSGRVSGFQAGLGSILNIKPLLAVENGVVSSAKIRGRKRALARLIQLVEDLGPLERLDLVHTHAEDALRELEQMAAHLFPPGIEPIRMEVTPIIGAHLGPDVVGFAAIQAAQGVD